MENGALSRAGRGLTLTLALLAFGIASAEAQEYRTLTVTGEGRIAALPDTALVEAGVTTQAATAAAAMAENSAAMARVLEALGSLEIAPRDLQTRRLQLFPVYAKRTASEPDRITGYRATNQLQIRVRQLDAVGRVLDRIGEAGINEMANLQFVVADPAPLLDRARVAAVEDARHKAELLAREAGIALGEVRELREGGGAPPPVPGGRMAHLEAAAVPIATGELEFNASVSIVYAIATR
jgi:uncharacterized protein YggE